MKSSLVLVAILSSFIEASEVIHDGYMRAGYQYQDEGEFAIL